jgi:DNA-directed RNA polymerase subunit M/transcription elongation factor TFIIS
MQERRTRRGPQEPAVCTQCGGRDAIQIELTLPDGSEVRFSSCHRCEHRWWSSDGEVIDLTTVLDKARKR